MAYKLFKNPLTNTVDTVIYTDVTNVQKCIPFDDDNTDYQTYLKWVEAGNTADPAD
tara:strand:+ start:1995 stop:2162 length:168 start_codon:yes stop_codon:yes gene_type:complete